MTDAISELPGGLDFILEQASAFPSDLASQAVELTALVFPGEEALQGKFYYDSPPALVACALDDERLVALRPIERRQIDVAGNKLELAGGIIPTVHPDYRRRGIASAMVDVLLSELTALGVDYSLAFLFDGAPEWFLAPFGYARQENRFVYTDRQTGKEITETARAHGKALRPLAPEVLEVFASNALVHLGRGIW